MATKTVSQSFIDTHPKSVAANPGYYQVAPTNTSSSYSNTSNNTNNKGSTPEWNLSSWKTDGTGKFSQAPVLTVNGQVQNYNTPDEYVNALSNIKSQGSDGPLDQFINEFNAVRGEFKTPNVINSSLMGTTEMPKATTTTNYTPATSNLQATLGINTNQSMIENNPQLIQQGNPGYSKQQMQIRNGTYNPSNTMGTSSPVNAPVVNTMGTTPSDPNAYANTKISGLTSTLPQGVLAPIISEIDKQQALYDQQAGAKAQMKLDYKTAEKAKTVNDIEMKQLQAKLAYDMQVAKIRENASGSFGGAMEQDLNKAEIDYMNKSSAYGIQKALANSDLESANTIIKQTLDATYEPIKQKIDSSKDRYNMYKDSMTDMEKLVYQAMSKREEKSMEPQSITEQFGTGSIGEYNFAKSQGYKGTFNQYQDEDANRKTRLARAGAVVINYGGLDSQQSKAIDSINSSIEKNPAYQKVIGMRSYAENVQAALSQKTGVGDIAAINQFQKIIDEGAVTRDQDVKLIQGSQSLANSLQTKVNKLQKGEQLSPELRNQMLKATNDILSAQEKAIANNPGINAQKQKAERYKIPVDETILGELTQNVPIDTTGKVRIQKPDGSTGYIPKANLSKAISAGAKQIK